MPKLDFKKFNKEESNPQSKPGVKINFALNLGSIKNDVEAFIKDPSPKPTMLPMDKLKLHSYVA